MRAHLALATALTGLAALLVAGPYVYNILSTTSKRYDLPPSQMSRIPFHHVGLVFGAGILPDGTPTPYLKHRVETAVDLYKAHRIDLLLMSGDNSTTHHNEPIVMQSYAMKLGVPRRDIILDYAGFNTYDSCYRAHAIFGLNSATLISQGYHLPRAVATCDGLGVKNVGVVAKHPGRDFTVSYIGREFVANDKLELQLLFKPNPTALGKPLPIN